MRVCAFMCACACVRAQEFGVDVTGSEGHAKDPSLHAATTTAAHQNDSTHVVASYVAHARSVSAASTHQNQNVHTHTTSSFPGQAHTHSTGTCKHDGFLSSLSPENGKRSKSCEPGNALNRRQVSPQDVSPPQDIQVVTLSASSHNTHTQTTSKASAHPLGSSLGTAMSNRVTPMLYESNSAEKDL